MATNVSLFASRLRKAFAAVGLGVRSSATQPDSTVPLITSGTGAPSAADPDGSIYLRRDGASATTVYVRVGGAWTAVAADGDDFGAGGIQADAVDESTAAAGVTVDGLLIKDSSVRPDVIADPGDAGAIPVTSTGTCALTSAGAETRTLAVPSFAGQRLDLSFNVDAGDIVLTAAAAINQTGNNTLTFADAGDHISLVAVTVAAGLVWRVVANDGVALSTV